MRYLIGIVFFSSIVFGYSIEFNKRFSKEIGNDEITSYISISSKHKTQKKAINGLNRYKKFMDKSQELKKTNIRQNSYPEYRYEKFSSNNKRVLDGYKATLNYIISSTDSKKVAQYIENILKIKKDFESIQVSFSNLTYQVSKKKKEQTEDTLRLEAIIWSQNYVKELSKKLQQTCEVTDIRIGTNSYVRPMQRDYLTLGKGAVSMESSAKVSMPTPSDTNISINSSFKFECK